MADEEKQDLSTSPQEPQPLPAEEQQHEGSWPASDAGSPADTQNLEHDRQAEQGPTAADEAPADSEHADEADAPAEDAEVTDAAQGAMDYPRVQESSSEVLAENPEVDLASKTHPDLETEVGLPLDPDRLDNQED